MIIPPRRGTPLISDDGIPDTRFAEYLEAVSVQINQLSGNEGAYTESNVTSSRSFDADTVTLAELADIVGTLIADLRSAGIVK